MSDVKIKINELKELIIKKLCEVNMSKDNAEIVADVLSYADAIGVRSHGTIRLEHYCERIKAGGINLNTNFKINFTNNNSILIDAEGGMGHCAVKFAMENTIKAAKEHNICVTLIKNVSHCGALSYYSKMAVNEKLISMVLVNTDKCVVPFGGAEPYFGTNPICYGFPGNEKDILIDMATSEVALGKVFSAREANKEIPNSWGVDENGHPTTDPNKVVYLSPMAAHKGTALATMVEGFTGLFTGAFGKRVNPMYAELDKYRNIATFILVINPNIFGNKEEYLSNTDIMINDIKTTKKSSLVDEIYYSGEIEAKKYKDSIEDGVYIYQNVYNFLIN